MIRTSLFAAGFMSYLALGVAACGDSSEAEARGAAHIVVRATDPTVTPANMACNQIFFAEEYIPPDDYTPNDVASGAAFASGESGIQVSCRVSSSGGFNVDLSIGDDATTFELRGELDESGQGTSLAATVSRPEWIAASLSSRSVNGLPCTMTATGGAFFVKRGSVYASFNCPVLTFAPDTACRVSGHVYFERCSG